MEVKVELNNIRIAPRKSREVIDLIRNKDVNQARALLQFTVKRAAEPVLKLLNSAVASATHDVKLNESNLYISRIFVDEGPKLKRSFPMSRGRAYPIMKRTSHITLVLSERNAIKKETTPAAQAVTPKKITRKKTVKKSPK